MAYTREDAIREIADAFSGTSIYTNHCREVVDAATSKLSASLKEESAPPIPPDLGITIIKHLHSLEVIEANVTLPELGREIQSKLVELLGSCPSIPPELKEALEPILEFVVHGRGAFVDDDNEVLRYRYGEDFRVITIGDLRRIAELVEPPEPVVEGLISDIEQKLESSIISQIAESREKEIMEDKDIAPPPVHHYWQCDNCNNVGHVEAETLCPRCGIGTMVYKKVKEVEPAKPSEPDGPPCKRCGCQRCAALVNQSDLCSECTRVVERIAELRAKYEDTYQAEQVEREVSFCSGKIGGHGAPSDSFYWIHRLEAAKYFRDAITDINELLGYLKVESK